MTILWGNYKPIFKVFINDLIIEVNGKEEYLSVLEKWLKYYEYLKPHIVDKGEDDKVLFFEIEEEFSTLRKLILAGKDYLLKHGV